MSRAAPARLSLFAPPYRSFLPIGLEESFPGDPRILRGTALIWNLGESEGREREGGGSEGGVNDLLDRVAERPAGMSLVVVLPPATELEQVRERVLAITEEARPQTVLPHHPHLVPAEIAGLLRREPENLADEFIDFLAWRGIPLDQETRWLVHRTVELSGELRTLAALARGVYMSRRALGRRFRRRGLPVPSHWLQFSRLLRATIRLQNSRASLLEVACSLGYPDGFTLSNQMHRLVGVRPSEARERLGWEWFVEAWLQTERASGGLQIEMHSSRRRKDRVTKKPEVPAGSKAEPSDDSGEGAEQTEDDTPAAGGGTPDSAERSEAA